MDSNEYKQGVTQVFSLVADAYDNEAMRFFPFCADHLIEQLQLKPGDKLLDVATGTGVVAMSAAQLVGPAGRVQAIDLAEGMLQRAQHNCRQLGLENVDFHVMDAEALEFRSGYFDAVACSFGLFFLPDMPNAVRQWTRVLKPGGRLMSTSFGLEAFQPMLDIFREQIGRYEEIPPEALRPYGVEHLKQPGNCEELLTQTGLVDIEVRSKQLGYHLTRVEEWWDVVWNSGFRGLVLKLSEAQREQFQRDHLAELQKHVTDKGLWMNVQTLFSSGRKPAA